MSLEQEDYRIKPKSADPRVNKKRAYTNNARQKLIDKIGILEVRKRENAKKKRSRDNNKRKVEKLELYNKNKAIAEAKAREDAGLPAIVFEKPEDTKYNDQFIVLNTDEEPEGFGDPYCNKLITRVLKSSEDVTRKSIIQHLKRMDFTHRKCLIDLLIAQTFLS
jgi:hypothetical protein